MINAFSSECKGNFTFSIVMAVYNTAPFLSEAIESLLVQDIGFSDNVQLIMVDDGSTDGAGDIADEYALRYPQNIFVIHKCNGGVSSARNEGLKYVAGKYVNFLDSDDKLSKNTLSEVAKFFEAYESEVDLVSIPFCSFDKVNNSNSPFNKKFQKGTRLIDLEKECNTVHLSLSSSFIRAEVCDNVHFDIRLKFGEDAKECLNILSAKKKIGVISNCIYYYRVRSTGELSATQMGAKDKEYYIPFFEYFIVDYINKLKEQEQEIPKFMQHTFMYYIAQKLKINSKIINGVLSEKERSRFEDLFYYTLRCIDDDVILNNESIFVEHRCFLIEKKYDILSHLSCKGNQVLVEIKDKLQFDISRCVSKIECINPKKNSLLVEASIVSFGAFDKTDFNMLIRVNNEKNFYGKLRKKEKRKEFLGETILSINYFAFEIENWRKFLDIDLAFYVDLGNEIIDCKNLWSGRFFPVSSHVKESYYIFDDNWMIRMDGSHVLLKKATEEGVMKQEERLIKELQGKQDKFAQEAVHYRKMYFALKPAMDREIWLISDRINRADDNGEALFRYISENCHQDEDVYFVIDRKSSHTQRLEKYGKVIDYLSAQHKLLFLLSDKLISSGGDEVWYNPFGSALIYYSDIISKKKRIFIQHGIIENNLSDWLNYYNKNLSLFTTSVIKEYHHILEDGYLYDKSVVKLCGLARLDYRENKREKMVILAPSWRQWITNPSEFRKSNYFKNLDLLINNKKLLEKLKEKDYIVYFMPHPNMIPFIEWFHVNDRIRMGSVDTRYHDLYKKGSLFVTDYSSAAFDFAFLNKPVIYFQFDKEDFFKRHTLTRGYFDYERDGFGEIEESLKGIINRIVQYLDSDCELKDKYKERIDGFFTYHDKNNCKRVYDAIKTM